MLDFFAEAVRTTQEAREKTAELGGLPEITEAASSLMGVIEQTREQIVTVEPASRYLRTFTDTGRVLLGRGALPPATQTAIELDGEAGFKEQSELAELAAIESQLNSAFARLVDLRAGVIVTRTEL